MTFRSLEKSPAAELPVGAAPAKIEEVGNLPDGGRWRKQPTNKEEIGKKGIWQLCGHRKSRQWQIHRWKLLAKIEESGDHPDGGRWRKQPTNKRKSEKRKFGDFLVTGKVAGARFTGGKSSGRDRKIRPSPYQRKKEEATHKHPEIWRNSGKDAKRRANGAGDFKLPTGQQGWTDRLRLPETQGPLDLRYASDDLKSTMSSPPPL